MNLRLKLVFLVSIGAALACGAPADITPSAAPAPQVIVVTATSGVVATATSAGLPPAPGGAAQPTVVAPLAATGPRFNPQVKFSTEANPATATRTFKQGTKRIYAMWDYMGMTDRVNIRREWYLNGLLWLTREEAWNMAKYGAQGTVIDVSIFDMEKGLDSGQYELRLYIDNTPQFAGAADIDFRTFTVGQVVGVGDGPGLGPGIGGDSNSILSPDGKMTALVENGSTLSSLNANGVKKTLVTVQQVDGVAWMPDSLHIVYGVRNDDGSGTPFGITYDLFVANATTGAVTKLSNENEDLHTPVIAPDGKHIAVLMGNNYGDACAVSRVVAILEVDPVALTRLSLTQMGDFSGLEPPAIDSMAYAENGPDFAMPGLWQGPSTFKIGVRFTCVENGSAKDGVYALDMLNKSATKVGEMPKAQ